MLRRVSRRAEAHVPPTPGPRPPLPASSRRLRETLRWTAGGRSLRSRPHRRGARHESTRQPRFWMLRARRSRTPIRLRSPSSRRGRPPTPHRRRARRTLGARPRGGDQRGLRQRGLHQSALHQRSGRKLHARRFRRAEAEPPRRARRRMPKPASTLPAFGRRRVVAGGTNVPRSSDSPRPLVAAGLPG